MNALTFRKWLDDMWAAKLAKSDAACGRLLGMTTSAVNRGKKDGFTGHTGMRTALACSALLMRVEPYTDDWRPLPAYSKIDCPSNPMPDHKIPYEQSK